MEHLTRGRDVLWVSVLLLALPVVQLAIAVGCGVVLAW